MKKALLLFGALGLAPVACTTAPPAYSSQFAETPDAPEAPADVPELPAAPPPPQAQLQAPTDAATAYAAPPAQEVAQAPGGTGQWVNTAQYGWVYMPYAPSYSYAPQPGVAYTYVYSSGAGWRWVTSPWVWGGGARPYFTNGAQYHSWYRPTYWGSGYRWGGVVQGRPYRGQYERR